MKKIETKKVSEIEGKIYKILDKLELTAEVRAKLENLVDELAMTVILKNK